MPEKLPKSYDKLIETISTLKKKKNLFEINIKKLYHQRNKLKITI